MKFQTTQFCLVMLLSGCALNPQPFVAYENKNHPLQDTAIFTTHNEQNLVGAATIVAVDGKSIESSDAMLANLMARVLPGDHIFTINFRNTDIVGGLTKYLKEPAQIEVKNMQPRHLYQLDRGINGDKAYFSVIDRGENSDVSIPVGLPGVNHQRYRPPF